MACDGEDSVRKFINNTDPANPASKDNDPIPWRHSIRAFLVDITGVLYNSGTEGNSGYVIPGSVEAVARLYNAQSDGVKVRFLSNESSSTRERLLEKLRKLGFTLREEDFITPAPIAARYVKEHGLRPHLLVHRGVENDFADCDQSNPNCVIMGDAEHDFTYNNMNAAFRVLMNEEGEKLLISLGCKYVVTFGIRLHFNAEFFSRFYQRVDGPCLDVGGFAMALKYASNCQHIVIGKPTPDYFASALTDMGLSNKEEVVMIGDDIISDVAGAQRVGIRAIQVRTGKWRREWENHAEVKPDLIADNLSAAVTAILDGRD